MTGIERRWLWNASEFLWFGLKGAFLVLGFLDDDIKGDIRYINYFPLYFHQQSTLIDNIHYKTIIMQREVLKTHYAVYHQVTTKFGSSKNINKKYVWLVME